MNKKYSYGRQCIDENDIQSVVNILKSDMLTQGPGVKLFENALCKKLGSAYCSVVTNGTAALHLTGLASGWQQNDIIITTPITFLATANCILYSGATPDFVDIEPETYTIDVNKLEDKIKNYVQKGTNIKAVIGVDYAGHPCDWENLRALADKYNFQLINDACHAIGAKYHGNDQYPMIYADIAVYSFHPVKSITTGEGGAVLTNNKKIYEKILKLRTHGLERKSAWYYEMHELGFNYRITDFQCALGISQLKKLDHFIKQRQSIAKYYDEKFSNDERFIIPKNSLYINHAYHLYPLQIRFDTLSISKEELLHNLQLKNIFCQVHYIPIHLQPFYQKNFGFKLNDFPIAENFYKQELSLPVHPQLEINDLKFITDTIREIIR